MKDDCVVIGTGLVGSIFVCKKTKENKKNSLIDKCPHISENGNTQFSEGTNIHRFHFFHTGNKRVWDYMYSLMAFDRFTHSPIAEYHDDINDLHFSTNKFHQLWRAETPEESIFLMGSNRYEKPRNNYSFADYKNYGMDYVLKMPLQEVQCPN